MKRTISVATALFLLLACGGGGTDTPTPAPQPPVIQSFSANPPTIFSGQSSTLTWSTSNATSLSISQLGAVSGTTAVVTPTTTTTYTLTAGNGGQTATASATITVQPQPALPPPTNFKVENTDSIREFKATWNVPSEPVDGYELEVQIGNQSYQKIQSGLIPALTTALSFYLETAAELEPVAFRIRSAHGSRFSPYAPIIAHTIGLESSGYANVYADFEREGIQVAWDNPSLVAQAFRLERGTSPSGPWTVLVANGTGATSYFDQSIQDGISYFYRITNLKGAVESAPVVSAGRSVPVFRPSAPMVVFTSGNARLTWQNRSTTATQVVVTRTPYAGYPATTVASLPFTATEYIDVDVPAGMWGYLLRNVASSESAESAVSVAANVGGSVSFGFERHEVPSGTISSLLNGRPILHASAASPASGMDLNVPSGVGYAKFNFPTITEIVSPGPRVGPAGLIQFIGLKPNDGYDTGHKLYHFVQTATGWNTTLVATHRLYRSSASSGLSWTIDPNGNCHIVWLRLPDGASFNPIMEWATNIGGTWSAQAVNTAGINNLYPFDFDVTATGEIAIAIANTAINIVQKPSPGYSGWENSSSPVNSGAFWYDPLAIRLTNHGMLVFFESRDYSASLLYKEWVSVKTGYNWSANSLLGTHVHNGTSTITRAEKSPDGNRVGYLVNLQEKGFLMFLRDNGGDFKEIKLGNLGGYYALLPFGFTSDQKLFVIVPPSFHDSEHAGVLRER